MIALSAGLFTLGRFLIGLFLDAEFTPAYACRYGSCIQPE